MVDRPEAIREASAEGGAAVAAPAQKDELVGFRSERRLVGIERRLGVVDGEEAFDFLVFPDVGEQLAAFRDFLDELIPADGLPLALASSAARLSGMVMRSGCP